MTRSPDAGYRVGGRGLGNKLGIWDKGGKIVEFWKEKEKVESGKIYQKRNNTGFKK